MNYIQRRSAVILLVLFAFFHLGMGQRLFHSFPSVSKGCCAATCGCAPTQCQCEHSDGKDGVVYEAPECSLVKTSVNGVFGLMFFLPEHPLHVEGLSYSVFHRPATFLIPPSFYESTLEKPPRIS